MAAQLSAINVLAELERASWKYEPTGSDEVKCLCPAHDDKTPSASVNVEKREWRCHACKAKGDFATFLAYVYKTDRKTILVDLGNRYDVDDIKAISPETVEKYHQAIDRAGPLLKALEERGITREMIRSARLGYWDGRITIPVYDLAGRIANVRRYLPGAPSQDKMRNTRGYGKLRLYRQADVQTYRDVWICGGEMKALLVGSMLESKGVGACAATGGEGAWHDSWSQMFKGKRVYVCMDVDSAGIAGAKKIAERVYRFADVVKIVKLPLSIDKYPKGDVNDYVGREGATADDLIRLMAESQVFEPGVDVQLDEALGEKSTTLEKAASPEHVGWKLSFDAIVSAADMTPYLIPKVIDVACTRDQPNCGVCSVYKTKSDEGVTRVTIDSSSRHVADLIGIGKSAQKKTLLEAIGVPDCAVADLRITKHAQVHDVRLASEIHAGSDSGDTRQPALIVDGDFDLNSPYAMSARVYPHARTQQAILVVDGLEATKDSLSSFAPSASELTSLEQMRFEDPREGIEKIYDDLEANVTKIYGRREMHLLIDLAFHSVLKLRFDDREINGWLNVLVIGDSAQGKTETATRLMEHYQLGERLECKNASVAGLLGGLQQMGTRWFISWGAIPMHDRRLVVLEELKGAPVEVISKLTDMRSSGIAEIPKIERRKAHARTRIVALSNPRSDRALSTYSFGVEAVQELIGSPEDVRRFDAAVAVAAGRVDVDAAARARKTVKHVMTSELSRRLIMWAWTRTADQVVLEPSVAEVAYDRAKQLCDKYVEDVPLIDRGTTRAKLARLAAALAARTFSADGEKLIVKAAHVDCVADLLDSIYSDPAMGYADYSKTKRQMTAIVDAAAVKRFLTSRVKHPMDLVRGLLYRDDVSQTDIQDWCEVEREPAASILSFLVRMHCLRRSGRSTYVKSSTFIELLKALESSLKVKSKNAAQDEEF